MKNFIVISVIGIIAVSSAMFVKNANYNELLESGEVQQLEEINKGSVDEIIKSGGWYNRET